MIKYETTVPESHTDFIAKRLSETINSSTTEEDLLTNVYKDMTKLYSNVYSPLMIKRYVSGIPDIKAFNHTVEECVADIQTINTEHLNLADNLIDNFNERQNHKNNLIDKINVLSNNVDDALFLNDQLPSNKTVLFRDSFCDTTLIDFTRVNGNPAEISTKEGIARLNVTSVKSLKDKITISKVEGEGEFGNTHMVVVDTSNKTTPIQYAPANGNDLKAIVDEDPTTYFEYSIVGVTDADKKKTQYYDIDWAKADQSDILRARIIMTIDSQEVINMITLAPFFYKDQSPRVKVLSIRGSVDGVEYSTLFSGPIIVNPNLNVLPDTYVTQNLYLEDQSAKLTGAGVFVIKPTKLKYIEIIMEQDNYFKTNIGHTVFQKALASDQTVWTRIRSIDVPVDIRNGELGKHTTSDGKTIIDKSIEIFSGWKYSIGIKDIGVYKFEYAVTSEIVSTKYSTGDPDKGLGSPISKLYLETSELTPEEFKTKIDTRNNYIRYYITFDDQNWIEISPLQRTPFGTEILPPKLIEIDAVRANINSAINANKYNYESSKPIYNFRVKVVFKRPTDGTDINLFSPMLEEYRVKVELK